MLTKYIIQIGGNTMTNYIEEISNNCLEGDYLMLDVPGSFQFCVSFHGMDQLTGTYLGVRKDKLYLLNDQGKEVCAPDDWVDIEGYTRFSREDVSNMETSNLEDVKSLDLVLLEHDGKQTLGFYQGSDKKSVGINMCRRGGYELMESLEVPIKDISGCKVLEKFVPDASNALDDVLISSDLIEAPPGYYG